MLKNIDFVDVVTVVMGHKCDLFVLVSPWLQTAIEHISKVQITSKGYFSELLDTVTTSLIANSKVRNVVNMWVCIAKLKRKFESLYFQWSKSSR